MKPIYCSTINNYSNNFNFITNYTINILCANYSFIFFYNFKTTQNELLYLIIDFETSLKYQGLEFSTFVREKTKYKIISITITKNQIKTSNLFHVIK